MDNGRNLRCLVLLLVVAVSGVEETCEAVPEEDEEGKRGVGEIQDMETGDEENQDDRGNGAEDSEGKRGEISMGLRSGHGYGLKTEFGIQCQGGTERNVRFLHGICGGNNFIISRI